MNYEYNKGARELGFNIKPIVILSILLVGILFLNYNFELAATKSEQETTRDINNPLNSRNNDDYEWGEMLPISEPVFGKDYNIGNWIGHSRIAVEGDKVYTVWQDSNDTNGAGTDNDIFYRYFDGKVWGDIQVISEPVIGMNYNTGNCRGAAIAVDNDKIYVVWHDDNSTDGSGTDKDISIRTNLTGNGWEDIQVISEPSKGQNLNSGDSIWPSIAVEDGNIYVAWGDESDMYGSGTDQDTFFRCNLGTSWESIQAVSEPVPGRNYNTAGSSSGAIDVENGKIYIVWSDANNTNGAGTDQDIFFRCNLTNSSWEKIQVISEPVIGKNFNIGTSTIFFKENIAVENGKIYVLWKDTNNTNNAGTDGDTFYRCNLTGTSWEDIQVISEPVFGQDYSTEEGAPLGIEVEHGRIYVAMQDFNDTNGAGFFDLDIYFRCNLTGEEWKPIQVISEPIPGSNYNNNDSYLGGMAVNNGKCHFIWKDGMNVSGSGSVGSVALYRWLQVRLSPLFISVPRVTPLIGNTSTEFNFTAKYYHLNNSSPTGVKVFIDGTEHSMVEVDTGDNNYIDGKHYFFKLKNLDIGEHTYRFWASNGSGITTTSPKNFPKVINIPPKIITQNNITAIEDTYYKVDYDFEDIDLVNVGQSCFWEFFTNASWLKFISNPPTLYGTPTNDDVGRYWVNIIINDNIEIDQKNFTLTVIDVNDNPEIVANNIELAYEDEFYEVEYSAIDIDSPIENQIWSFNSNATSWLNFDLSSKKLNGTPTNDDVGDYWINISVADGEGGIDSANFTLSVVNVNDRPIIITVEKPYVRVYTKYETDYEAIDIDSPISNQVWSLETNASWLSIDPSTGILNGTPMYNDLGWYDVNVTVNDGDGGVGWQEFILSVMIMEYNVPPIITSTDVESINVNEYYEVDYNATDDNTPLDLLTWYLETNASWLSIDMISGILSGRPAETDVGWYWVNVSVFDYESCWAHHNFTLEVIVEPTIKNNAPILSNPSMTPEKGNIETEFTFSVHYYDMDSDAPIYIRLEIDIGSFDMELKSGEAANGIYECLIVLPEGEHQYYFTASDGKNIVTTDSLYTPYITAEKQASKGPTDSTGFIGAAIILIIIVIILLFLFIHRKRMKQKKDVEQEPAPPVTTPVLSAPVESQTIQPAPNIPTYPATPVLQQLVQPSPEPETTPTIAPSVIPTTSQPEQQAQPTAQEQPQPQKIEEENKAQEDEMNDEEI